MNLTRAIFLYNDSVRGAKCTYENEEEVKNAPRTLFKTFDKNLKVGDYVVVPTDTRHKMTVVKVVEFVDNLDVDIKSSIDVDWIVGRVDKADYAMIKSEEEKANQAIKSAQKKRERDELRKAMEADIGGRLTEIANFSTPVVEAVPAPAPAPTETKE